MIHKHYLLPLEYASQFSKMLGKNRRGITVEDFTIGLDSADLVAFPDFESFAAAWLGSWKAFFDQNTAGAITQDQAFQFCSKLSQAFDLET
jgi:hypothetical protein